MTKGWTLFVAAALLGGTVAFAEEEAPPKPQYVGVEGCETCHKRESTGDQLGKWQESRHSKAYETLASPKAKEIAAAKGIADPQKADECLSCHVTAHGVADDMIATPRPGKDGHRIEDGVACESCHGPGSEYRSRKTMQDREASIAAGMLIPDEQTCLQCHNEKSPTYKPFDYEERLAKIAHPNPKNAEEAE